MKMPFQHCGVQREVTPSNMETEDFSIIPSISCKLDLTGKRTRRRCTGPPWARVCVNVPEFKEGQCRENGSDCTDCYGRCRDQFTSAGGWTIASEWGRECQ